MARTQGKGWFRTRKTPVTSFFSFTIPKILQPGIGGRKFTSSASPQNFPMRRAGGQRSEDSDSQSSLTNPFPH